MGTRNFYHFTQPIPWKTGDLTTHKQMVCVVVPLQAGSILSWPFPNPSGPVWTLADPLGPSADPVPQKWYLPLFVVFIPHLIKMARTCLDYRGEIPVNIVHCFRSEYGGRFVETPNESPASQLSYAVSTNLLRCSVLKKIMSQPWKYSRTHQVQSTM